MTEPPDQPGPSNQPIKAEFKVVTGLTASVSIRNYMANQHLWNARREAWLCRKREETLQNLDRAHLSHAMMAVLSAVAFLEAFVNAVWQDAADSDPGEHTHYTDGIPDAAVAIMRELWTGKRKNKEDAERMMSLQSKFQIALVCAGRDRLDKGAEPYQSVDVLIDLRNELVHFKPQWWHDDGRDEAKFVAQLREKIKQTRQSPFAQLPLGAGCADWACSSVIAFARDWHSRMGLAHDFDKVYLLPTEPFQVP
ncbi:hypothetical protein A5747_03440 [Mycobacterium sp. IS-836]|uniref:hypothetical protein n=1 Tax=Mycobacterium sp. IS-836 TaxID=1834160 RepID=UPI00096C1F23|nr:hypothetical protein [Mycobacterium sp. IS-836]OMC57430.1 hypothetical protein A5747_03440 [Mycobacterium sp. IS-836]